MKEVNSLRRGLKKQAGEFKDMVLEVMKTTCQRTEGLIVAVTDKLESRVAGVVDSFDSRCQRTEDQLCDLTDRVAYVGMEVASFAGELDGGLQKSIAEARRLSSSLASLTDRIACLECPQVPPAPQSPRGDLGPLVLAPEISHTGIPVGRRVMLFGLAAASLNGCHGVVVSASDGSSRIGVKLVSGGTKSVKAANLMEVDVGENIQGELADDAWFRDGEEQQAALGLFEGSRITLRNCRNGNGTAGTVMSYDTYTRSYYVKLDNNNFTTLQAEFLESVSEQQQLLIAASAAAPCLGRKA
jgi:hypothetical protein